MARSRGSRIIPYHFAGKQRFFIIAVMVAGILIVMAIAAFSGLKAEVRSNNSIDTDEGLRVDTTPALGYSMSIEGKSADGQAVSMWMVIKKGNEVIKSGLTPLILPANPSGVYSIVASDYTKGSMYFDHWSDGTTSKSREIVLSDGAHLVAYYRTKASMTSLTPTTNEESATTPTPSPTITSSDLPSSSSPASITSLIPRTGVIVPLYMYPSSSGSVYWQQVIDEKHKHSSVPIVAVFNPSTGPGKDKDSNFANWVAKLKDSGVIVLGYTFDWYGERSTAVLKADINRYHEWYAADGVFIDEFANYAGSEDHYREVTHYAKSLGMKLTLGNPGADVPKSYIGTVDVINISEGKGSVPISQLQYCSNCSTEKGWHYLYAKQNFSYTRYDISSLDTSFEVESKNWVGLLYITNGNDSDGRWFHLPPYFGTLVATLDR